MAQTPSSQPLYILAKDVYRLGSAASPKLEKVRPVDLVTYEQDGVLMIRATGIGVSVGTMDYLLKLQFSGWLWKIPPATVFPQGLILQADLSPSRQGHFLFAPFLICLWIHIAGYWWNSRYIAKGHKRFDDHTPETHVIGCSTQPSRYPLHSRSIEDARREMAAHKPNHRR